MQLTLRNLIRDDGTTNMPVLKAMARRRAISETGEASPRSIRDALHYYNDHLQALRCEWRQNHGLHVQTTMVSAFGNQADGVRRSAF